MESQREKEKERKEDKDKVQKKKEEEGRRGKDEKWSIDRSNVLELKFKNRKMSASPLSFFIPLICMFSPFSS